jgi:ABC-type multidrug transport system fused ATPase/permease subunit
MFKYSWILTLIVIAAMLPNVLATRISFEANRQYAEGYQKAKANMSSYAEESLSNIRTVKAFSDEHGSIKVYDKESF